MMGRWERQASIESLLMLRKENVIMKTLCSVIIWLVIAAVFV